MKMVKSLLLGTAAGLVAMTGAQAADLPVKAKPVQYVKICSLYGAGFYYVPGTDTCLKIGGWVRQYLGVNSNNNLTNGYLGSGNQNTRASNNGWAWKARGYITADARTQTEFGTLRSYIAVGASNQGAAAGSSATTSTNVVGSGFSANRAFIQLAGFTFGVSQSFYDLYPTPALSYFGGMINPSSDTSDAGQTVSAYTAQFGNGLSASLSLEAPRTTTVVGPLSTVSYNAAPVQQAGAVRYPDILANLRMDASWGSAQIMGGIHDVAPMYYTSPTVALNGPAYATGFFAGAGVKINVPMIGPGDYFSAQINYANGASGYPIDGAANPNIVAVPGAGGYYSNLTSNSFGFGVISDGVYAASGSVQLTTTWGVNAAYEHFWSKRWQTSVYGAYTATSYNSVANGELCFLETGSATTLGCNNNWNYFAVGSRTQFNVDSQTYIGLDVIYTSLQTADSGLSANLASTARPAELRTVSDQSAWMAEMRVHRNFYP